MVHRREQYRTWLLLQNLRLNIAATLVFGLIFLSTHAGAAVILSDNLPTITAGTETVSGNTWLAGSFGTGVDVLTSLSATLLISSAATTDSVELCLYSDGGLEPGNQLATSPLSLSTYLSPAVFNASGLNVAANS